MMRTELVLHLEPNTNKEELLVCLICQKNTKGFEYLVTMRTANAVTVTLGLHESCAQQTQNKQVQLIKRLKEIDLETMKEALE